MKFFGTTVTSVNSFKVIQNLDQWISYTKNKRDDANRSWVLMFINITIGSRLE